MAGQNFESIRRCLREGGKAECGNFAKFISKERATDKEGM